MTLRAQLYKVKERLSSSLSIWHSLQRLENRIEVYKDTYKKGELRKSAIAKHSWNFNHHPILREETSAIDRASRWRKWLVE